MSESTEHDRGGDRPEILKAIHADIIVGDSGTLGLSVVSLNHLDDDDDKAPSVILEPLTPKKLPLTDSVKDVLDADAQSTSSRQPHPKCPCLQKLEGRDAWVVAFASVMVMFCVSSEMTAFGIYYVAFTQYFGASKSAVGWIKGIQTLSAAVVSVFGGALIKVYGCRAVAVMSGILLSSGFLLAVFSPQLEIVYVTYGILTGLGVCVATMSVTVIIQQHFIRNKVLGAGLSYFGYTIGGVTAPIFVNGLITHYGLRGALLVHAAIVANIIPFGLLFRPARSSKTASEAERVSVLKQIRHELLDFSLFKEPLFPCALFVVLLVFYNVSTFISHLPGRAVYYGAALSTAAYLQSIMSMSGAGARFPCMFLANSKAVNKLLVFAGGVLFSALGSVVYGLSDALAVMMVAPALFGLGMGTLSTVMYPCVVHLFTLKRLPKVIGFVNVAQYLGLALGPPLSGLFFDRSGDYNKPFFVSGALAIVAACMLVVIFFVDHRKRKVLKQKQKELQTL